MYREHQYQNKSTKNNTCYTTLIQYLKKAHHDCQKCFQSYRPTITSDACRFLRHWNFIVSLLLYVNILQLMRSHYLTYIIIILFSRLSNLTKGISNKQVQNRHVTSLLLDTSSNIKTAKDVQFLLNNIGISTRASKNQIETLMEKASNKNSQQVTASDIIELIARVRSV